MPSPDIVTYLNQIKNGVYGEDVRDAIHDAIEQCYNDGRSGSTDIVARRLINQISSAFNLSKFETTLWERTSGSNPVYGVDAYVDLSNPITDYDYIDVYLHKEGYMAIHSFPAMLNRKFMIREANLPYEASNNGFTIVEMGIGALTATRLSIIEETKLVFAADGTRTASIINSTDEYREVIMGIIKVVGRKFSENSEILGLRVSGDEEDSSEEFESANDAIQAQLQRRVKMRMQEVDGVYSPYYPVIFYTDEDVSPPKTTLVPTHAEFARAMANVSNVSVVDHALVFKSGNDGGEI